MQKNVNDIRELAKLINLSTTTVSRVLNGKSEKYRISSKTAQRVIKAAQEYEYSPSKIARGLKMDRTDTIGLIIPDISNPFFADIAQSIEKEARMKGFSLILCDSGDDLNDEKELIGLLRSHKVDGMIIAPVGTRFEHIIQVYNSGIPIVVIDRCFPDINVPSITSDNYQGGYDAVNYLISLGHKKIICIQGKPESLPSKERLRGYIDACKENDIKIDKDFIMGDSFTIENGYRQTRIIFSMENPPTAVFAFSNLISLGVIKAVNEMGMKIPDDISLISFDEQPYSAYLSTPMTTVSQKKSEIGQLSIDVLLKYIMNKEYWKKVVYMKLKTSLIIRDSVKNLREY
ncbi:MAG: LacI family DNA-binding transcriptional regulator [Bacteroidales bacterium]